MRERCGYELSVLEREERNVLKWFGLVKRMLHERLIKRCTGQLQRRWRRDEMKEKMMEMRLSESEGIETWRMMV